MNLFPIRRTFTAQQCPQAAFDPRQVVAFIGRHALSDRRPPVLHDRLPAMEGKTTVRRVRASDAEAFQGFILGLSAVSRRMRFHGAVNACTPALLRYLTQTDNVRHQAWLAFDHRNDEETLVGEARFVASADGRSAEFAIAVADDQRGRGVADRLLQTLLAAASRAGVEVLFGDVLDGNARMSGFLRRHGFETDPSADVDAGIVRWQRRRCVSDASRIDLVDSD